MYVRLEVLPPLHIFVGNCQPEDVLFHAEKVMRGLIEHETVGSF